MNYHGIWDLDELYDMDRDPDQMHNLIADADVKYRLTNNYRSIGNPELKEMVGGFRKRMWEILGETDGETIQHLIFHGRQGELEGRH